VKLLIKGGRVIDPASKLDRATDVLIENGRIAKIEDGIDAEDARTIEASGLVVCPGFFDMHVHLREPGEEWKETVKTGTAATELIVSQAKEHGSVPVYPIGAVTKGQEGKELAEMEDMIAAGACAFSDDGRPIWSSLMMRKALEYSKIFDVPIIDHCEDADLVDGGVIDEGEMSTRLGLKGWPSVAEDIMVQRDLLLAEYTGGRIHIAHLSTARGIEFVREAKRRGVRATCEVTPHHFALTSAAVGEYDTNAKMNPPLRSERDREAMLEGLADGTVDAIATDHAPHHADEKCVEFAHAPFGIVGLETVVPICIDRLVHAGVIDLMRMVELLTTGPADVLRLDKGRLEVGREANVTLLDMERRTVVTPEEFRSKCRNTPFDGLTYKGAAAMTIVAGRIVHAQPGLQD